MKKIITAVVLTLVLALAASALTACGGTVREVTETGGSVSDPAGEVTAPTSDSAFTFAPYGNGYAVAAYNGSDKEVVVPSKHNGKDVIAIGTRSQLGAADGREDGFAHCYNVEKVTLPDTIREINVGAFSFCTALRSVNIPDSCLFIGEAAFKSCGLTALEIPVGVREIGALILGDCRELKKLTVALPADSKSFAECYFGDSSCLSSLAELDITGAPTLDSGALSGCTSLMTLHVPTDCKSISLNTHAFSPCKYSLTTLYWNAIECSTDSIFKDFVQLKNVYIGNGVKEIRASMFSNCTSLSNVTIPDTVTSIGSSVFSGCSSLTSISLPNGVTTIGSEAFSNCTSLAYVPLPDMITSIGSSAFLGCTSLTSITISGNVTSIGSYAFSGCENLKQVTFSDPNGWSAGRYVPFNSAELKDPAKAADYLTGRKSDYYKYTWIKESNA